MPLITSATPSTLDESVQPQTSSHGESSIPVPSPSATRNEASETSVNHYSSLHTRSDEHTAEQQMSPMEDIMLQIRSWYNYCCYSDMSEVQKCVQNYCGSVWTDFSTLVGLRSCTSTTAAHWKSNTGMFYCICIKKYIFEGSDYKKCHVFALVCLCLSLLLATQSYKCWHSFILAYTPLATQH